MTTTVKSAHWRADTNRPGSWHRINVRVLVTLAAAAAAIATALVLVLSNSSPTADSPQIAPRPQVGIGNLNAPVGPAGPLQCVPSRYVHAC
jgi:hypothetical protein